ncbi:unnamed protein product, partial [marine sediment metagenome]
SEEGKNPIKSIKKLTKNKILILFIVVQPILTL